MTLYYSTFVSGFQDLIPRVLARRLPGAVIRQVLDGAVLYEAPADRQMITSLRCFNNSFAVLRTQAGSWDGLSQFVRTLSSDAELPRLVREHLSPGRHGFRVVVSRENQLVPLPESLLQPLEKRLARGSGLYPNRGRPQVEFWLLFRREGLFLFLLRLTRQAAGEARLEPGELRPELANLLCELSDPDATDVFLDPFCGSGSIPLERASLAPYRLIFAQDTDPGRVKALRQRVKGLRKPAQRTFFAKQVDARSMEGFDDSFVDKVVTDPPWGLYEALEERPADLHREALAECVRVLRPNGLLVWLTARDDELEAVVKEAVEGFVVEERYPILVSGRKASVYRLRKRPHE